MLTHIKVGDKLYAKELNQLPAGSIFFGLSGGFHYLITDDEVVTMFGARMKYAGLCNQFKVLYLASVDYSPKVGDIRPFNTILDFPVGSMFRLVERSAGFHYLMTSDGLARNTSHAYDRITADKSSDISPVEILYIGDEK